MLKWNYISTVFLTLFFHCNSQAIERTDLDGHFSTPSTYIAEGGANGITWRYTENQPNSDWVNPSFDDSGWQIGHGGFYDNSSNSIDDNTTPFDDTVWLRTEVELTHIEIESAMFWGRWDDNIEIYINGIEAVVKNGWVSTYRYLGMSDSARNALHTGTNTIAVKVNSPGDPGFFDVSVVSTPAIADLPVSGYSKNPQLNWISNYAAAALSENGIPAASLAITRRRVQDGDTQVMYAAGFGYMEKEFDTPVRHDSIFRLASVDKPVSFAALKRMLTGRMVKHLDENGNLDYYYCDASLDQNNPNAVTNPVTGSDLTCADNVLDLLSYYGAVNANEVSDSRAFNITITDILNFQSGFTARPNPQNTTEVNNYYSHLGITAQESSPTQLMKWYFSNNLTRDPGTSSQYNSDGAAVVRFLVGKLGNGLENYLQNQLLSGSSHTDLHIAHEYPDERVVDSSGNLREPWYLTHSAPFDFWIGLDDAMALAASAETIGVFKGIYGYGRNDGGMQGTQAVTSEFGKDYDNDGMEDYVLNYTWLISGSNFPFGQAESSQPDTQYIDSNLRIKLLDLPVTAWEPQQASSPCSTQSGNLIGDCTFTANGSVWSVDSYNDGSGYASYSNQELRINVTQPGAEHWYVQAVTPVATSSAGNYILTFQARAENSRSIVVNVGHDGSDDGNWESYYQEEIEITQSMKSYTLYLPKIPTDNNARLDFNVGNAGINDVFIDEIYLGKD
ncbi:serine hydrolase [Microbulbifer halophilus]|uniref:Serine hydrolase n=1 Tax=Microbulbifer halophilus TaxID=453963 RepID=A0ABW5EIQ2_9GAMM|nr:serine hydrolase domain-containing protein [Microbulbifer halophilus]MCW8127728.1 serine hydrolase [Microbulbifer halophilus]